VLTSYINKSVSPSDTYLSASHGKSHRSCRLHSQLESSNSSTLYVGFGLSTRGYGTLFFLQRFSVYLALSSMHSGSCDINGVHGYSLSRVLLKFINECLPLVSRGRPIQCRDDVRREYWPLELKSVGNTAAKMIIFPIINNVSFSLFLIITLLHFLVIILVAIKNLISLLHKFLVQACKVFRLRSSKYIDNSLELTKSQCKYIYISIN